MRRNAPDNRTHWQKDRDFVTGVARRLHIIPRDGVLNDEETFYLGQMIILGVPATCILGGTALLLCAPRIIEIAQTLSGGK